MSIDRAALEETRRNAIGRLLAERHAAGHWVGELSSSALSTAVACVALALVDQASGVARHRPVIDAGLRWLVRTRNADGGWGDTDKSKSNISTTCLCWAALSATVAGELSDQMRAAVARCEVWIGACETASGEHAGALAPDRLAQVIAARYGKDRTFSVPILMTCAVTGRLGPAPGCWRWVRQLPFELAACPHRWFKWLRLPVVSYALPALIAIGQARHHHRPTRHPIARLLRGLLRRRTLDVLQSIQPGSGGFLEATPLTSFVTMALVAAGHADHAVVRKAVEFLERSQRLDGSWAIDTNLATWVTTQSVNALAAGGKLHEYLNAHERRAILDWLLNQQYRVEHPYTHAAPGGWAWTDLPGGVPDADDTAGALIALHHLAERGGDGRISDPRVRRAVGAGLHWLCALQNHDGGTPTFCRGWGHLPFDRSGADLTAHAVRALTIWGEARERGPGTDDAFVRGLGFLGAVRNADATWTPLWFGHQDAAGEANPLYGTARVLLAMPHGPAVRWLLSSQHGDGGWGGVAGVPPSTEETALAVEALATVQTDAAASAALARGVAWLIEHTQRGTVFEPSPIGFYFAKLWYYEKLYPLIFTVAALERVAAGGAGIATDERG